MTTQDTAVAAPAAAVPSRFGSANIMRLAEKFGLLAVFVLIYLYFWLLSGKGDSFATLDQTKLVLVQRSVFLVLGLAFIVPLLAGQFDLSVAHNLTLTSVVTAQLTTAWKLPTVTAALIGIALATAIGAVVGVLVAHFEVHSLIASLGVQTVLMGTIKRVTDGGRPVTLSLDHPLAWLGRWPYPIIYAAIFSVAVWYVLEHTPFGRRLHAVGANPSAARLSGIPAKRMILLSFVIAGFLAGCAGVLQMTRDGSGNPQSGGVGFLLPVFAAAFLGATAIKRTFNVWGTTIAVLGLAFTVKGLNLMGAKPYVEDWFNGTALLVATVLTAYIGRLRGRRMFM